MRYYQICVGITFSILLFGSCVRSDNGSSPTISDSFIESEPKVLPIKDININGRWKSNDNRLYPILEFRGKSTVVVETIMGSFASSYERDEEFIRVRTDKSDLIFEIVSEDSIIGSGFAKGVWIKEK